MHTVSGEDTHFYLDNAPPDEVAWVLRCLAPDAPMTNASIAQRLLQYGVPMQRDRTYSSRRLYDLGLAEQATADNRLVYILAPLGVRVRDILAVDPQMYADLMHYLHYGGYDGMPSTRKYLWSYRCCCDIVWAQQRLPPRAQMATAVQTRMRDEFGHLDFTARTGARFDATAAGRCYLWFKQLSPSPFPEDDSTLQRRVVQRYELALLALDDAYRVRDYRYGDPVVLDAPLLDQIARVFFLQHECCRELLSLAAKLTPVIRLQDTFAGTSITLLEPYAIERI